MKFIQEYRFKMLIPELLVVFGLWYLAPESLLPGSAGNMYRSFGLLGLLCQPLWSVPSGVLALVTAFTLHGIYPMDNYHEGKIPELPRGAIILVLVSFLLLPLLVTMQMIGYFMTEATEYIKRSPFWERVESLGDLLFYAGPVFFVGLQWWLLVPVFFLSQAVDGIHKIAHHETASEPITAVFYFLWPVTIPLFFDPIEVMAMAALSIPAFAFYSYIRPYYTYVTAVHTLTFALLVVATMFLYPYMPLLNTLMGPGWRPPPPDPWW